MADKDHFLKLLNEKFTDLQKIAIKNKYKVFIPLKKFITENMLNEGFYSNHIFYVSKYDESMYINLNGRVLRYEHPKFTSVLGWKKKIEFSIKYQFNTSYDLSCKAIDNVSDEQNYIDSSTGSTQGKSDNIKRFQNMDEYLKYYSNIAQITPEYRDAMDSLEHFVDLMKNNYIFMKGHEEFYSFTFLSEARVIQEAFKNSLGKTKDENLLNNVVSELVDSLIFSKMYDFLFGNLIQFHQEEEQEFKTRIKELPTRFELGNNVDEAYRDCKFEKGIALLKTITKYKTIFEKLKLITDINAVVGQEAKEAYEKMYSSKKQYNPQGDLLLSFWTYLVSHSDVQNIVAEATYLKLFNIFTFNNFGESSYLSTTFITAVNSILEEGGKNEMKFSITQNIQPSRIYTNPISSVGKKATLLPERSQSMSNRKIIF